MLAGHRQGDGCVAGSGASRGVSNKLATDPQFLLQHLAQPAQPQITKVAARRGNAKSDGSQRRATPAGGEHHCIRRIA
jgi:hypothetical protein